MLKEFVDAWMLHQSKAREKFVTHPKNYADVVRIVVDTLREEWEDYEGPDPDRIHEIDDGHYQGTLLYVIGDKGYQPSTYWYVKVYYGSCSGCDTLEAIRGYDGEAPTEEQINDYMNLALHIVQGLKEME